MPQTCSTGIVMRYANYKDNDRILTVFTPDKGRIDVKAQGCRRVKSPLAAASQPFVYAEFELFDANGKYVVNQATVNESFFPIREDIEKYAVGSSMLQLCCEVAQEDEPNEALFQLLYYALSYLAYDEIPAEDLFYCFLSKFLDISGYRPSITKCAKCGADLRTKDKVYFDVEAGGAVCGACGLGAFQTSKTALEAIRRMIVLDMKEMNKVRLNDTLKKEVSEILLKLTEYSLEYGSRALGFFTDLFKK